MFKSLLILAGFSLFGLSMNAQSSFLDCTKFHDGKFQLTGKKADIVITREGNIQTETHLKKGATFKYIIEWISDCKFALTPLSEEDQEFFNGKRFIGEIIDVKENSYTCVSGFEGDKTKVTDLVLKAD